MPASRFLKQLFLPAVFIGAATGALAMSGPDSNGDAKISQAEFHRYIEFRHMTRDHNRDGALNWHELTGRFTGGSMPYSPAAATAFLQTFDLDRSGDVSAREMIYVISYSGTFDRIDTNDDGLLSHTETRSIAFLKTSPREGRVLLGGVRPE